MDGSPELLFLDEGPSGPSVKIEVTQGSSTLNNNGMISFEPGLLESAAQPASEITHTGRHKRLRVESSIKKDFDSLNGRSNNSSSGSINSISSSFENNTDSNLNSAVAEAPAHMELCAIPGGSPADMTIRIRRKKVDAKERLREHSEASLQGVVGPVTLPRGSIEDGSNKGGRNKRNIEEDQSSILLPSNATSCNDNSSGTDIGNSLQVNEEGRMKDETLDPMIPSKTAFTGSNIDYDMLRESTLSTELSLPLSYEEEIESARNYTFTLPTNLLVPHLDTILKISKKRKIRNPNVLTESSVPLSELIPHDVLRRPRGE